MKTRRVSVEAAARSLPPCVVVVENGRVMQVDEWCLWGTLPWKTLLIRREANGEFFSSVGDPEHGGGWQQGSLKRIMEGFDPSIQAQYHALFELQDATRASIQALDGFRRYKVQVKTN